MSFTPGSDEETDSHLMLAQLVCPACRVPLRQTEAGFDCPQCAKRYVRRQGILSFVETGEEFNVGEFEGKQKSAWNSTASLRLKIRENSFLSFLNKVRIRFSLSGRRDRLFLKEMSGGSKDRLILDLGCGGGRHYFTNYGRVIGIDPVLELLQLSAKLYDEVYHCGGFRLPFADESFDYVVSTDVLGHILPADKNLIFDEIFRVLKKGGRTAHLIETDSTNYWFRLARQYPELFQKYFIDLPGHVGLELPTDLRARFLRHGFKEVRFGKLASNLAELGTLDACFGGEFRKKSALIRGLVGVDGLLAKCIFIREPLHFVMEPLAILDDWITPLDHGCGVLVVFEK